MQVRSISRTVISFFAVFILSFFAMSQTTVSTGSIQGTVSDPSGAAVGGAEVAITNKATGQASTLTTNGSGS